MKCARPILRTYDILKFFTSFFPVLETYELKEKIYMGISPCIGDLEFERKNVIGILPCTGDFEFFDLQRVSGNKNVV